MILYTAYTKSRANAMKVNPKEILSVDIGPTSIMKPFAPSKELYYSMTNGSINEETFIDKYREQLEKSICTFKKDWKQLVNVSKLMVTDVVKNDIYAPRWILREYLARACNMYNIPFVYRGEISGPLTEKHMSSVCISFPKRHHTNIVDISSINFQKDDKGVSYVDKPLSDWY